METKLTWTYTHKHTVTHTSKQQLADCSCPITMIIAASVVICLFLILNFGRRVKSLCSSLLLVLWTIQCPWDFLLCTHTNRKTKTTDRNTHTHIREGWWFALPLVLRLPECCWAKGGVPNPLSVRNTSLNPNVWRAKSFFQLGPARLASIDYVTLGKSSIKSSNRSLEEKVSISFFLLKFKGCSRYYPRLISSVLSWLMGWGAVDTREPKDLVEAWRLCSNLNLKKKVLK